jgi:hypothetical protein
MRFRRQSEDVWTTRIMRDCIRLFISLDPPPAGSKKDSLQRGPMLSGRILWLSHLCVIDQTGGPWPSKRVKNANGRPGLTPAQAARALT